MSYYRFVKNRRLVILAEGAFSILGSKTATCVIRYRPEEVVAVIDSANAGRTASDVLGFGGAVPVVSTLEDALPYSPDALLIGIAPKGGRLPEVWRGFLKAAVSHGLDVLSGMHTFLSDDAELVRMASDSGVSLIDLRRVPDDLPVARCLAADVAAFVVLTVGTDCGTGKMTVSLEMALEARKRGLRAHFAATGQTGIYIAGGGIAVDRVMGDFIAGAAEKLVLDGAAGNDVVFVEGQGSLIHPGYSGVTLALMHGALPDALILCHQPSRTRISEYEVVIPPLPEVMRLHDCASKHVKPSPVVGIGLNCFDLSEEETRQEILKAEKETGLPATDCVKYGAGKLVDAVVARMKSGGKVKCAFHSNP
ncbi:MAG: DUF1611 domain-containing protein [Candidatus Eisenbacteria bacterium]|nr:DUF1611 domain-containing protein [Candidatus Eisenbacteria bacterium]